ncbi:MAG: hypothetical protein DSY43_01900 [Gammaproteobacteria bacterium]|nr:MAG: hypothetical protein DSY43_01900 [Gammaproteobacteria bacterium]
MSSSEFRYRFNAIGVQAKSAKKQKKQNLIQNIRGNSGESITKSCSNHNGPSCPVTRSSQSTKNITVIAETSSLRLRDCAECKTGPLDLSKVKDSIQRDPTYLHVICQKCGHINNVNLQETDNNDKEERRGRKINPLARRAVLGCLHQGLGHSQYEGLMASMNIKAMSENTFKRAEREVGVMIEETSKESCDKWRKKEKRRGKGVGMKASYDAGWQKQGRAHNSRTGQGTMVGLQTGKCIDYGTKNAYCRKCVEAEKRGADPKPHDCRLNHVGSAKAMESSIAIEICQKDQYQVLIGDDDSTVISRLRAEVNSNLEKWSDINHATCTLTKALYEGRGRNFGPDNDRLNEHVIDHVKTCFTYALHQNKNNISGIVEGIKAIVPHSFGDHTNCGQWCRQRKDPEAYRHSTLPSGRDLRGDGLKHFLNDVLQPFTTEEVVKKLAPLGSTQRNECINGIVGTKNPKKRFYGGSESSDYRVSAAVAQFNEGYQYLKTVEEKMGCAEEETLNAYITRMQRKRKQCTERKQKRSSKRRRKELKGKRKNKQKKCEKKEGTTYSSGNLYIKLSSCKRIFNNILV